VADLLYERGDYSRAAELATENLASFRVRGLAWATSRSMETLALIATAQGAYATARSLLEEAVAIERAQGNRYRMTRGQLALARALSGQKNVAEAADLLRQILGEAEREGDLVAIARILEITGGLIVESQTGAAVRLAAASETLRANVGVPTTTRERTELDSWLSAARRRLGKREYATQWQSGLASTARDAIRDALNVSNPQDAPAQHGAYRLTTRELEVLRLLALGRANRQVATALVISERTVARHLEHIYSKLGVSSRAAATSIAVRTNLV
jgi:ATP/maltotriose-dependent transcriptional regulator MalT